MKDPRRWERRGQAVREQLEELLGVGEVLQPNLAERDDVDRARELGRGLREEDLLAVARRADALRPMDLDTHVLTADDAGLAGVDAHSDPDAGVAGPDVVNKRTLGGEGGGDCVMGAGERGEEGVALRRDDDPSMSCDRVLEERVVLRENLLVVGAETLEEARRSLDVGAQQGHGPSGKRRVHNPSSASSATRIAWGVLHDAGVFCTVSATTASGTAAAPRRASSRKRTQRGA